MKKILLFFILMLVVSCASEEEKQLKREKTYFLNEDFILVDKKEDVTSKDGTPVKIRTWVVHRINNPVDSIYVGEISSTVVEDENCACMGGNFYISNELWYNKEIGDNLHFDHIRKSRFYKVKKEKVDAGQSQTPDSGLTYASDYQSTTITGTTDLEKERRMMEIERQILALQRELESLK